MCSQNYVLVSMGNTSFSLDPLFCDPDQDNWQLSVDSPCAPAHSPVCGRIGALPVGCGGEFIRVPDEHPSILAALNAAVSGDTVAVAEGVYLEHITLKPAIKLLGGWRSDFAVRDPLLYPSVIDARGLLSAVVVQSGEGPGHGHRWIRDPERGPAGRRWRRHLLLQRLAHDQQQRVPREQGRSGGRDRLSRGGGAGHPRQRDLSTTSRRDHRAEQSTSRPMPRSSATRWIENQGTPSSGITARFNARPIVSRNIIVNGREGFGLFADKGAVPITSCNNVWMNALGDYFGVLPGPNSLSEDPRFCPGEHRFLAGDSPCAPDNAPAGLRPDRGARGRHVP